MDVMAETEKLLRRLKREKIREPGPGQHVDRCHYSKTGWGIWNVGGGCTCKPARRPKGLPKSDEE